MLNLALAPSRVYINGTLVDDTMRRFKDEFAHFIFNKCPIYTHDGASAKFSSNSHETDNSVLDMQISRGYLSDASFEFCEGQSYKVDIFGHFWGGLGRGIKPWAKRQHSLIPAKCAANVAAYLY